MIWREYVVLNKSVGEWACQVFTSDHQMSFIKRPTAQKLAQNWRDEELHVLLNYIDKMQNVLAEPRGSFKVSKAVPN